MSRVSLATSRNILGVLIAGILLSGCFEATLPASVSGLKEIFRDPGFAVQGATRKDQAWISEIQEGGIQVLGWKRPPARARVLAVKAPRKVAPTPQPKPEPLWRRMLHR